MLNAHTQDVLEEVLVEREHQDARWGEQNHPDGTGDPWTKSERELARIRCDDAFKRGEGTWRHVLSEEVAEALAESDEGKLRTELIQAASVAVAWVEAIDRRKHEEG